MGERFAVDTSSLLILAQYFAPFDTNQNLKTKLEKHFENNNIILLASVYNESKQVKKGLVTQSFPFLTENRITKIENQIAETTHHKKLDEKWAVDAQKRLLENGGWYEKRKQEYIKSADFQLIVYAQQNKLVVITEESSAKNDSKLFKKIPAICKEEKISCENIVYMLEAIQISVDIS
jgi:hypothetical protein